MTFLVGLLLALVATGNRFGAAFSPTGYCTAAVRTPLLHKLPTSLSAPLEVDSSSSSSNNGLHELPLFEDSVQEYEQDVAKVLRQLRPYEYDPTVPKWFRQRRLSFTNYWALDEWEQHTSRRRYFRNVFGFLKSRLVRRILPQLSVLGAWSAMVCLLATKKQGLFAKLEIPLTALSLVSTFIAALLTLRSNQGLARLKDGRLAAGSMVHYERYGITNFNLFR